MQFEGHAWDKSPLDDEGKAQDLHQECSRQRGTVTDHFQQVLLCEKRRSTSSWVGSGQLPGWIHHDDIELCGVDERGPVIGHDIGMDGDAVRRDLPLAGVQVVHIAQGEVNALLPLDIRKL